MRQTIHKKMNRQKRLLNLYLLAYPLLMGLLSAIQRLGTLFAIFKKMKLKKYAKRKRNDLCEE